VALWGFFWLTALCCWLTALGGWPVCWPTGPVCWIAGLVGAVCVAHWWLRWEGYWLRVRGRLR
jgi:hypothetical protein